MIIHGYRGFFLPVVVSLALLIPINAMADSGLPLVGYPHATMVYHTDTETDDYRLALGALKKINNVWRAEQEQRLRGALHRNTLEIDRDYSAEEVFDYYADQLQRLGARELFSCRGRSCGSSSSWANNRFHVSQLYGLDQYQYYGAFEVEGPAQKLYFVALYTVLRGNKRVYAQIDILHSNENRQGLIAANPETIAEQLKVRGVYLFTGFSLTKQGFEADKQHLQALVDALNRERQLRVAVVGHDYSRGGLEQQRQSSRAYADYVKQALLDAGIDNSRVESYGVGGLAPPRNGNRSARVEIVRVNPD